MSERTLDRITGVILAGGKSVRFGSNKALTILDGLTMLEHTAGILGQLFENRLLITNTPEIYRSLNWPMAGDLFPGAGPLAGIQAALSATASPLAFVTGCDMPQLNPTLIRYLCTLPGEWDVVLPLLDNGPEPLHAVYCKSALASISAALSTGTRKLQDALTGLAVRTVTTEEILTIVPDLASFNNINTQQDLACLSVSGCRGNS
ncbi:MAG: hypothetical protein A2511_04890 [Deltaproteobacteria bacterium RIFOXYD12_FULL_50_9]|nr:MAG: hypothetical protein A2511_04890 [Deltaproteobacteria bacterium RIFOXYD12_FULL_50_9]